MAYLLNECQNKLHVKESLIKLLFSLAPVYLLNEPNHVFNSAYGPLYVRPLHSLWCVLHDIIVKELAKIVNEDKRVNLIGEALIQPPILADVDKRVVLSDPVEEFLDLLPEHLNLNVCFRDRASYKYAFQDLFKTVLFRPSRHIAQLLLRPS